MGVKSKGLGVSNPPRSTGQSGFCAALPRPAGNSRAHAGSMRERFVFLASDLSSYITGE
jgi:hypothetical protein